MIEINHRLFQRFSDFHSSALSDADRAVLGRLETDQRMALEWKKLSQTLTSGNQFHEVLAAILSCRARAGLATQKPAAMKTIDGEFDELLRSIKLLRDHFDRLASDPIGDPKTQEFKSALAWADGFLRRQHGSTRHFLDSSFSRSRQNSNLKTIFYVLLCGEFRSFVSGSAEVETSWSLAGLSYNFIATVTDVVYLTADVTDPDSVRKAHQRDRKREACSPIGLTIDTTVQRESYHEKGHET